ncbi:MAG: tyrosine--tRNA ligase [Bacilli bacterium]|jgi:tyrosyl-tRNA synthetase|nr:tyrosine--tRNA ligase [Bacilli bacterium]
MKLYEELQWRGLIDNISDDQLIEELNEGSITFYIGIDPSAASLHIGHFCSLLTARRLKDAGHNPLLIAGGATGLIGDPKPNAERPMISIDTIRENIVSVKEQMKKVVDCEIINNYDWHSETNIIKFLRDYGKHFNVNYMLSKETVKRRLEVGITFTEFSYMLLQAIDFLNLYEKYNCRLQIGGQDQWGNITAGLELIRKIHTDVKAYALTMPLITKADGTKFGKTETGTVWLDSNLTSPYELYQFFINTEDEKVIEYLKKFTFLTKEEIDKLEIELETNPELRNAQKKLGEEVVKIIHGQEAYEQAIKITNALFSGDISQLTGKEIEQSFKDMSIYDLTNASNLVDLLVEAEIVTSKREAREFITSGAIFVNGNKVTDLKFIINKDMAIDSKYIIIRKGKKKYYLLKY